jgi:hypothetical protein
MKTLYLAWQDPEDRHWFPVGRLSFDGHVYRFVYTKGAKQSPRFVPFGMMRDLHAVYESVVLFPLFANRLLSKTRPEYRDCLAWLDVPDHSISQEDRRRGPSPCPLPPGEGAKHTIPQVRHALDQSVGFPHPIHAPHYSSSHLPNGRSEST